MSTFQNKFLYTTSIILLMSLNTMVYGVEEDVSHTSPHGKPVHPHTDAVGGEDVAAGAGAGGGSAGAGGAMESDAVGGEDVAAGAGAGASAGGGAAGAGTGAENASDENEKINKGEMIIIAYKKLRFFYVNIYEYISDLAKKNGVGYDKLHTDLSASQKIITKCIRKLRNLLNDSIIYLTKKTLEKNFEEVGTLEETIDKPDVFFRNIHIFLLAHIKIAKPVAKYSDYNLNPEAINSRYKKNSIDSVDFDFKILNDFIKIFTSDFYVAMMRLMFPFIKRIDSRILDDHRIGTFLTAPSLSPYPLDPTSLSLTNPPLSLTNPPRIKQRYTKGPMPDFSQRTNYIDGVSAHEIAIKSLFKIVDGDFSLHQFKEFFAQLEASPTFLIPLILENPTIYAYTVKGLFASQSSTPEDYEDYKKLFLKIKDGEEFQRKILRDVEEESRKPTVVDEAAEEGVEETETSGGAGTGSAGGAKGHKKNSKTAKKAAAKLKKTAVTAKQSEAAAKAKEENDLKRKRNAEEKAQRDAEEKAEREAFIRRTVTLAHIMDRERAPVFFSQRRDVSQVVEWKPVEDPARTQKFFPSAPLKLTSGQKYAFNSIMESVPITMAQALNLLKGLNIPTRSQGGGGSHITITGPDRTTFQIVTPHGGENKIADPYMKLLKVFMEALSVPGNIEE